MTYGYKTFSDGGARGNPGPAAIGAVIYAPDGSRHAIKKFIGHATNNQAEYRALIAALEYVVSHKADIVDCFLDSELLVKQMRREYRVKDAELGKLFLVAWQLASQIRAVRFTHIPREKNKEADALVNEALDNR
ncbi:ribonuclease HI family protein [Candidatus Uhrbacteria bacterium]|nr:ribonuclease HI family protein [Candidatus Uhrbacteria bacterium]